MFKSILAVIVSYLVMMILLFAIHSGGYLALGAERVFQSGTYVVAPLWLILYVGATLCAAIVGGYVCAAISRSRNTCRVFAGVVFTLTLLLCIPAMRADSTPRQRNGPVSSMQALHQAQTPLWVHLLNPLVAVIGVLAGSCRKRHAGR
jgi:hypothetical protein